MGIQTIIKKVKTKRGVAEASARGSEATSKGNVFVPTTSGFIEVPSTSDVAKSYFGSGGGSSGPSGRGGTTEFRTIDLSAKARAEAEKRRKIAEQMELVRQQAERVKREKLLAQQIRSMSASKRRQFFRDQARISRALRLQQLQEQGVRLTTQSKMFLNKVQKEFSQRQPTSKQTKEIIPENVKPVRIKSKTKRTLDIIGGGFLTEKRIYSNQEKLNKQIDSFNKKFSERELGEQEYKNALEIQKRLDQNQKIINEDLKKLEESTRKKIGKLVWGKDSVRIDGVDYTLKTGTVPITPVGTVGALSKADKIKFFGKQKTLGNVIKTDIVFVTNQGKRVGIARGITFQKGKLGRSIVAGRSGRPGVSILKGGKTIAKRIRSFVGRENVISKPSQFMIKSVLRSMKGNKKLINVIKRNIQGMKQMGVGLVVSARGKTVLRTGVRFPSARAVTKKKASTSLDTFVSVASVLTRNQISKIIGKTITSKGRRAEFIGYIKGTGKLSGRSGITGPQKQEYKKALEKVISTVASAEAKAGDMKGLTKAGKIAVTSLIVQQSIPSISSTVKRATAKQVTRTKTKQRSSIKLADKQVGRVKSAVKTSSAQKQRVGLKSKQQTKLKQPLAQRGVLRQRLTQAQAIKLIQKQALKQITGLTVSPPVIVGKPIKGVLVPIKTRRGERTTKRRVKVKRGYDVFVRPLRKRGMKKLPKLVKVNIRTLTKDQAEDLRNYLIDTSLSRYGKVKKSSRAPKKPLLKIPRGYAKKTKRKFRKVRIVKKKGRRLPKGAVIEKRKNILDTKQEKKGITLKRRLAQLQKKKKRKITLQQKKILLARLKKARAVRMRNLKKRSKKRK